MEMMKQEHSWNGSRFDTIKERRGQPHTAGSKAKEEPRVDYTLVITTFSGGHVSELEHVMRWDGCTTHILLGQEHRLNVSALPEKTHTRRKSGWKTTWGSPYVTSKGALGGGTMVAAVADIGIQVIEAAASAPLGRVHGAK